MRLTEKDDPISGEFSFEVFAAGGPLTGLASPDNFPLDTHNNNLWIVTDMSSDKLNAATSPTGYQTAPPRIAHNSRSWVRLGV
jgi:hypothetical protein